MILKKKNKSVAEPNKSLVEQPANSVEPENQVTIKIIDGKLYDTSKANKICSVIVPVYEIPDYKLPFCTMGGQEVIIYKGRTEYFITYYCYLHQVTEEWVKKWLGEQNLDKYIELFGVPELA